MVSVSKEFSWDMAHMLAEHEGLCKNLHGHTYKLEVQVTKEVENRAQCSSTEGMVIDFKELKQIVNNCIIEPLDHAFMYWTESPDELEHSLAETLEQGGRKIVKVNFRPTAEMMAVYFFDLLKSEFANRNIILQKVKVWETPSSYAEVRRENI
ncbi:6-carboxytetrahydropterin synthase QueD [Fuchsiella alkaliacetigena]|uniref:6-carboxytetrahydropterin synthase QueD n=1 Tax=Fuchsiella alkaliacetigena TaxID=957042 RepID=UPI002009EEF9|nr:6-carboxytetrahydropterin synthase QueD [Fuchsiella alkaliacetigena]MCK8824927.1 6-carboxytetrahydropterin synthase QueD [Fuchsiella alkaliacetigena]